MIWHNLDYNYIKSQSH